MDKKCHLAKKNKNREILPFSAMQMNLKDSMLNKISQLQKDKFCMITLKCGIKEVNFIVEDKG